MEWLSSTWSWILNQLGWSGDLGWFKILVLVLAVLGALFLLRRLLGGGSSSGSTVVYSQPREPRGFPTRVYTGSEKLSDFSVPSKVYDFSMPSPEIKTEGLRKPLDMNIDLAKKLFVPPKPSSEQVPDADAPNPSMGIKLNWDLARKLFIPNIPKAEKGEPDVQEED